MALLTVTSHEVNLKSTSVLVLINHTGVNSLVAGQVAFVAESSLAVVALVRLVAVNLGHVVFQRILLYELGVTSIAEIGVVCRKKPLNEDAS